MILVSYDFSRNSEHAVQHAAAFARNANASLLLLHVYGRKTKEILKREKKDESYIPEKLEATRKEIAGKFGLEVESATARGSLIQELGKIAREKDALFLFMGTMRRKKRQWFTGSFALHLVRRSPIPVVVVRRPTCQHDYKKILYPLDIQAGSKQKVKWAKTMHQLAGSHIELFVGNYSDKDDQRKIQADLNQVKKLLEQSNVSYGLTQAGKAGSFHKQMLQFAKEKGVDAIMITSDPEKILYNPFNMEEKMMFNPHNIPIMFIHLKNLNVIIGGR